MDNGTRSIEERADEAADPESERTARELRVEIERTREDMSETVEAIQEKLRPSNMVASAASATTERVKDMAYDAASTAGEWWEESGGSRLIDKVRNNPLPTLLAGIGVAWLLMSDGGGRHDRAWRSRRRLPARNDAAGDYRSDIASDYRSQDYPRQESDRWRSDSMLSNPRRVVQQGRVRFESMIRQYPLAVSAAAVIVGASLGAVVPETERENELMGEVRDDAVQRAQDAASGAVSRIKDAAADAVTRAAMGD
jgi:Protein of unknown function (DUF3618)